MGIKKMILLGCVVVILAAFFLPWITVESQAVGGISKLLTGKKQAVLDSVSGMDVPLMANSDESRFMISIIKIFNPGIKDADKKSWLIILVPLLSVIMFAADHYSKANKWVVLGIGILGVGIFGGATFKIFTTDLDKLVMKVNIAYGLWILLLGYLAIGVVELLDFVKRIKKA